MTDPKGSGMTGRGDDLPDLVSPVEPHELDKPHRRHMDNLVQRIAVSSAVHGSGTDLLLRIYLAGLYHGVKLGAEKG